MRFFALRVLYGSLAGLCLGVLTGAIELTYLTYSQQKLLVTPAQWSLLFVVAVALYGLFGGGVGAAVRVGPGGVPGGGRTPRVEGDVDLVGPGDAGLSVDTPVTPSDLAKVPMIMLAPDNHVRKKVEAALSRAGMSLNAALEVEGQPLTFDLVRRGLGYTVLPYCAVRAELAAGRMSSAPIAGLGLGWALGVNRARAGAPAVSALIEMIKEIIEERAHGNEWRMPDG